jgi:peptidoglycan/xylan/chitin deacetylase (PgdA/CDA1 family)
MDIYSIDLSKMQFMRRITLQPVFNSAVLTIVILNVISCSGRQLKDSKTEISKWQFDKKGAVSITYDDGTVNQFRKAIPVMDELKIPGTFFINTGTIDGSVHKGTFIGRPVREIIKETATEQTDSLNFFERASAAAYLGLKGTLAYHSSAGSRIDAGNAERAYKVIDELYGKVRRGEFKPLKGIEYEILDTVETTWDEIRSHAARGHEFASHMVTHPRLAALDEVNTLYELEKSRDELMNQLGQKHIFSGEIPYGTENKRAIDYAIKVYPALRNDMREPFLKEIHRSSRENPGSFIDAEYLQWQRGATTRTPMPMMNSWIDTAAVHDNMWLVLVFHGVDGIGWEALTSEALKEYFQYIKSKDELWIATFGDVARYMRQRMNANVEVEKKGREIIVNVAHSLDTSFYNIPLTLKTYIPKRWKEVQINRGDMTSVVIPGADKEGKFIVYQVLPNKGSVILKGR